MSATSGGDLSGQAHSTAAMKLISSRMTLVKRSDQLKQIALSEIMNVGWSTFTNPERITLTLREGTSFGREIVFSPPIRFNPFSRSPIVDDLIERIDRQRSLRKT